ncbi:expressed unknown protein [Seminavis robusta]|uniref:Uncharacterized protein n=1 Tax=Seminavis robusta TaxID=568900 RepID=A0A9N8H1R2_9STRA|nr:expressed unknown protein [Seminavis robusta]|eukprot:Sro6_g005580.1 n/a (250) ;mRNA; r:252054-252803
MESMNNSNSNGSNNGSGAPTGSVTTEALLSSGLTAELMAQEIFSFLDRKSVLSGIQVSAVENCFQLTSYYCSDHGSKLECQKALREELQKEHPWLTKVDSDSANAAATKEIMECEVCVHVEYDYDRCPFCQEFHHVHDNMNTCDKPACGKMACRSCVDNGIGLEYCDHCHAWSCQDCVPHEFCHACDGIFCFTCRNFVNCPDCGRSLGCEPCCLADDYYLAHDDVLVCQQCGKAHCYFCSCGCVCDTTN